MKLSPTAASFCLQAYDYIIVGVGTAGSAIAAGLSADPSLRVGVLEAGASEISNPLVTVPGLYARAIGTHVDWNFTIVPQPALDNRTLPWPRGRMIGGSSGLNFMVWQRADVGSYKTWEDLGNEGWNFDEIQYYSNKAERFQQPMDAEQQRIAPSPPVDLRYHGENGPIQTEFANFDAAPYGDVFLALRELGVPRNPEPASGNDLGGWTCLSSIDYRTGQRSYGDTAYIHPIRNRSNLDIMTGVQATKIVFNENNEATGVEFVDAANATHTATVKKEVILSAGSVKSPQLLELSGIGSPEVLGAVDIEVRVSNPDVGEHLEDHQLSGLTYYLHPNVTTWDSLADPAFLAAAESEYYSNHSGILSAAISRLAFVSLGSVISPSAIRRLQQLAPNATELDRILQRKLADPNTPNIEILFSSGKFLSVPNPSDISQRYLTLLTAVMHPFSRGTNHIGSKDPLAQPVINPHIWEQEVDRMIMIESLKFVDRLAQTSALKKWIVGRASPPPGNLTDDQWWEFVKANTGTVFHPVGTCRLGAVVDSELRVKGVKNLRVADASIIPAQIAAHPQLTVYSIGEKLVDILLGGRGAYA